MTDDQMSCQTTESGTNRIGTRAPFQTNRKEIETVVRRRFNNGTVTTVLGEVRNLKQNLDTVCYLAQESKRRLFALAIGPYSPAKCKPRVKNMSGHNLSPKMVFAKEYITFEKMMEPDEGLSLANNMRIVFYSQIITAKILTIFTASAMLKTREGNKEAYL